jgi:hypothetical protein
MLSFAIMLKREMLNIRMAVQKLFGARKATAICLLLALMNKILIAWLYSNLGGDKSLYLLFTQSFLDTGIMAEPVKIFETGADVYLFNPAIHSPLYTLLAAPFLWITKSYFITQLAVSISGWIIFYAGLYKIAQLFLKERWVVNLFILGTGFFLFPHELASTPKDTLAVAFVLWSIFFAHRFFYLAHWKNTLLLALAITGFCLTKLIYVPSGLIILALIFLFLLRKKNKQQFIQYGILLTSVFIIGLLVHFFIFNPAYQLAKGQTIRLPDDGTVFKTGFYPQNLLHCFPFISSSVINTNFWGVQVEKFSGISFTKQMQFFRLTDLVAVLVLGMLFIKLFKQTRFQKVTVLLIVVSLSVVATVFYLSLTQQAFSYKSASGVFTFVMEARVFLLPMILLQLILFRFVFLVNGWRILRVVLLLLFLFECLHGAYFSFKQLTNASAVINAKANDDSIKKLCAAYKEVAKKKEGLVLVTSDNALRRYALLEKTNASALTNADIKTSINKGQYLIATHLLDSVLLKKFPQLNLVPMDTIHPFIVHTYTVE